VLRDAFLEGMSRAACTVSVVMTAGAAGRAGVTVSAMTSVSADGAAPSLLVCVNRQSAAAGTILGNGVFCVNVLREDQAIISDTFAGRAKVPSGDKFAGVPLRTLATGAPVLDQALVAFDCRLVRHLEHGTHHVLIGELVDVALYEASAPLIYANRAYGRPVPLRGSHRAAAGPANSASASLRVGCLGAPAPFVMGELLAAFVMAQPAIAIELIEADHTALVDGVRRGDLAHALTYDMDLGDDLEIEVLGGIRPYALLPAAHPLARRPAVTLADLAAEPMVLLDLPGIGEHQRAHFTRFGLEPLIGLRATSFELARSLVANGLGYAILVTKPGNDMSYSGKALASRPIADDLPLVRLVRISCGHGAAVAGAGEFKDLCRRHFAAAIKAGPAMDGG
jgi:flavin reductase (DIM6/NTAB) family NADH-FMN oxidoreductase RutF/DNA-binding transcriptional LysR family regulator